MHILKNDINMDFVLFGICLVLFVVVSIKTIFNASSFSGFKHTIINKFTENNDYYLKFKYSKVKVSEFVYNYVRVNEKISFEYCYLNRVVLIGYDSDFILYKIFLNNDSIITLRNN